MDRPPFRIVFMGTPDFAVPTLEALLAGPDRVVAVVTQPDRPKGRGRKLVAPPVKIVAEKHNIPVYQPTKIRTEDFHNTLKNYAPDLCVVAAYGRILPLKLLTLPIHGCINVHGSLLPRHRGAAPIQWAVIKGDREAGVTIMQMDETMDTGAILFQQAITPTPDETAGSLFSKIARLGSQSLMTTLKMLSDGCLTPTPQDHTLATPAPMLSKHDGLINWNKSAHELDCLIRGLDPWPTAFCWINGMKVQLFSPEVVFQQSTQPPGTLLRADREGLLVSTASQCLLIRELKPEGKKRMSCEAFLNGQKLQAGTRLLSEDSR